MRAIFDLHLEQLDMKIVFLHRELREKIICYNRNVLKKNEKKTSFVVSPNLCMIENRC